MRILTVTNMYPHPGHETYGAFVHEHVEALRRIAIDVDVLFTNGRHRRSSYLRDIPRVASALRHGAYDIVHAHHSYSVFQVACARIGARGAAPIVFTMHEGEASVPAGFEDPADDMIRRLVYSKRLKRVAIRLSDYCVAVETSLPARVGSGKACVVIAPGVDLNLFRPLDRAECRGRLGLGIDECVLFFPADRSRGLKGADLLEASLQILGTPVRTLFAGGIPHGQMPIYMNAADVVVQPSHYEASPVVVKEAMACNAAVVSTDVGDVAQLFGETPGCFCTPRDPQRIAAAIEKALQFDGLCGGRDRIKALRLSLDDVAGRYAGLYQRVYEGAAARAPRSRFERPRV